MFNIPINDVAEALVTFMYLKTNDIEIQCVCESKSQIAGAFHNIECPWGVAWLLEEGMKNQAKASESGQ